MRMYLNISFCGLVSSKFHYLLQGLALKIFFSQCKQLQRKQNKKAVLKCRACCHVYICIVQFADAVRTLHEKRDPNILFNSIRQSHSFTSYCWVRWITVVSMVTPTCEKTQTFISVWFTDKTAGCAEDSVRRSSTRHYEERWFWLCWLLPFSKATQCPVGLRASATFSLGRLSPFSSVYFFLSQVFWFMTPIKEHSPLLKIHWQ